ncbi:MAG TPA: sortase [Actinocrinis sp.]|nr:sortase [Actinocrinis sp.]
MTVVVDHGPDTAAHPPIGASRWNRAFLSRAGGIVLCTVAVAVVCLLAEVGVIGRFEQSHDQSLDYATLRYELANAIAPVGSRDYQGGPLALGAPLALLSIPAIGLNEVVDEGTTPGVLERGPGHRRDTVMPGQAGTSVIMGRDASYGGPFHYISQLKADDTIYLTTGQGTARYRVLDVRHAGDHDPVPPTAKDGRLTLITASGTAYLPGDLVRVDSELISAAQQDPGGNDIRIGADENPGAGDPGAWPQIILWLQLLVLASAGAFWARTHWGRAQAWLLGVPVLAFLGLSLADQVARLLPNLT